MDAYNSLSRYTNYQHPQHVNYTSSMIISSIPNVHIQNLANVEMNKRYQSMNGNAKNLADDDEDDGNTISYKFSIVVNGNGWQNENKSTSSISKSLKFNDESDQNPKLNDNFNSCFVTLPSGNIRNQNFNRNHQQATYEPLNDTNLRKPNYLTRSIYLPSSKTLNRNQLNENKSFVHNLNSNLNKGNFRKFFK